MSVNFFPTLSTDDFKNLIAETYAADAAQPANTDPGSSMGAIINASAQLAFQIEQQLLYLQALARLATCVGADIDSFCAPFNIPRDGAQESTGLVTFSTSSPVTGAPLVVPVGGIVQTEGGLQFIVIANGANYSASLNGYPIPIGSSSIDALVQCLVPGTIGNVIAGAISQIFGGPGVTPISGIASVTNAHDFDNGTDQEADDAYKERFTTLVSSGRVAVFNAIAGTILSVQSGLTYSIGDRKNADGSTHNAYYTVFVNVLGQAAAPSPTLLTAVASELENVNSLGISYQVLAPTLVPVSATAVIEVAAGYDSASVVSAASAAYTSYVNNIGLDPQGGTQDCSFGRVYAALFAVPGVANVQNLRLSGGTSDITAGFGSQLVAGTVTFTPG